MAGLRFADVQSRPTEFLDFTSLTLEEFQILISPFEVAFQAHMAAWRFDGTPRTARRFTVYKNCPLPTPEDRLFFLLTYLKTYSLQVVQGRLILIEAPSPAYTGGMLIAGDYHSGVRRRPHAILYEATPILLRHRPACPHHVPLYSEPGW